MCALYSFLLCFFFPVFSREITLSSDEPRDLVSRRLKNFVYDDVSVFHATALVLEEGAFSGADCAPLLRTYETFDTLLQSIQILLSLKTVRAVSLVTHDTYPSNPVIAVRPHRVPLIGRISIKSSRVEKSQLRSVYPLSIGDPYDHARHIEGVARMKELLDDMGYRSATVTEQVEYDSGGERATIFFIVDEGMRMRVATIDVAAVDQQGDTAQLARPLALQLTQKFSGEPLSREVLARLKEQVKRFLFRRGYHEATVDYHETH